MDCLVILCDELCFKSCVDLYGAGNGREIWVHKVNRRLVFSENSNRGFHYSRE